MSVHTSVRRSILQPISKIRVLGQKSRISLFHCGHKYIIVKLSFERVFNMRVIIKTRHYLFETAVHCVWAADVKAQQDCVRITVAQGSHVVIVWRTLEGREAKHY